MLCSERNCKRDIENHFLSYRLSGAGKIKNYDFLTGLVNSWTPKASGIAWWGLKEGKKMCQHSAHSAKKKTRSERSGSYYNNKRLSQQPALGALTFLRSFVASKANFCSHLLASLVHFTVVKSQAILIIRLGVAEVIYHS